MPLPKIDINHSNFNDLAFKTLLKKRGFIITGLGQEFDNSVENLFQSFDDFRKQPESFKIQFKGTKEGFSGYFSYDQFHYGGLTTERYFIHRNKNNKLTQPLPEPKHDSVSMESSSNKLASYFSKISQKMFEAIEEGLKIEKGKFADYFSKPYLVTINHYLPTTQEKIQAIFDKEQLTIGDESEIKIFAQHKDISLFSMLIYRQNIADGLQIHIPNAEGEMITEEFNVISDKTSEINVIILVGELLQALSNETLQALEHSVVTKPLSVGEEFSRDCIGIFVSPDSEIDLFKLVGVEVKEKFNFQEFFNKKYEVIKSNIKTNAAKKLPIEFSVYPTDEQIGIKETNTGFVYFRKEKIV